MTKFHKAEHFGRSKKREYYRKYGERRLLSDSEWKEQEKNYSSSSEEEQTATNR